MLRLLMVVCTLGAEWKDPEKIPVKDFINIWRSQSTVRVRAKRGRYEGEIWKAHMLRSRWRDQVVATLRLTFRLRWLLLQLRWLLLRLRHWLLCPPLPCSRPTVSSTTTFFCSSHRCWRCTACCCPDCSRTCRHRLG